MKRKATLAKAITLAAALAVILFLCITAIRPADSYTGEIKIEAAVAGDQVAAKAKVWHKALLDRVDVARGGNLGTTVFMVDRKEGTVIVYNPVSERGSRKKLHLDLSGLSRPGDLVLQDVTQLVEQLKQSGFRVIGPTMEGKAQVLGYACTIKKIVASDQNEKTTILLWAPDSEAGLPRALRAEAKCTLSGPGVKEGSGAVRGTSLIYFTSLREGAEVPDSVFEIPKDVQISEQAGRDREGD